MEKSDFADLWRNDFNFISGRLKDWIKLNTEHISNRAGWNTMKKKQPWLLDVSQYHDMKRQQKNNINKMSES